MKTELEIVSGVYSKPYRCVGIYDEKNSKITIKWREKHTEDEIESFYELILDKDEKKVTVNRSGNIKSCMEFKAGEETYGAVATVYGTIPVLIKTEYLNMPSVLSDVIEIGYKVNSGDNELVKNVFSVKRLLQNSKV